MVILSECATYFNYQADTQPIERGCVRFLVFVRPEAREEGSKAGGCVSGCGADAPAFTSQDRREVIPDPAVKSRALAVAGPAPLRPS